MLRSLKPGLVALLALVALALLPAKDSAAQQIELTQRADIIAVQERLKELGWYHGAIDGIVGSGTRSAARGYRQAAGLPPSSTMVKELRPPLQFINPQRRARTSQLVPTAAQMARRPA